MCGVRGRLTTNDHESPETGFPFRTNEAAAASRLAERSRELLATENTILHVHLLVERIKENSREIRAIQAVCQVAKELFDRI